MNTKTVILETLKHRPLIIDGAMGTELQLKSIPQSAWEGKEGCNELLNVTAPEILSEVFDAYLQAGADFVTTNTFGAFSWVLDEYGIGERGYELSKAGAEVCKRACEKYSTKEHPRFVLGSIGPGTKLPSLGHIHYDEMLEGFKECALGLIDGGSDLFILETCQDPLQIKAALHACEMANKERSCELPVMVSVTIELSGAMLIGSDVSTIAAILEPFDILSLGFNCGTGPQQYEKHVKALSSVANRPISIHANAGLPENRRGETYYPMGPEEFSNLQASFLQFAGVGFLGGCCGTTPDHIKALREKVSALTPKAPVGEQTASLASLFSTVSMKQDPSPLLVGERSNATGSKAFRELLIAEDYEGTLSVGQQQVRSGAHVLDVSVGFAGRNETHDMHEVIKRYAQKINLPIMVDSTQSEALESALKLIGGRPIINSVNLEDGIEKFDTVCSLAKKYGAALVCLTIDEKGMAKTKERKIEIASRIYELATQKHGLKPEDLVFDVLTFTVGSGDEEYRDAAIQTIEAIRDLMQRYPKSGSVLGLSNISFGLSKEARPYLNSVFLHHCLEAGMSAVIINVKHIIPMAKISEADKEVCENLLFNRSKEALIAFIEHFGTKEQFEDKTDEEAFNKLSPAEKVHALLLDGDKEKMLSILDEVRKSITPEEIVNTVLINAMKKVGELFGSGQMQLPFVLQSAETMKASVDYLNPYLPKMEKESKATLVLGTVKGDVHDVGKNLVDIILSNNGFDVINLGIKVECDAFIETLHQHNASAIGMSGLLVKSTQVMLDNLKALKSSGIDVPVLLGGAALTRSFIDEYCRVAYDGPIYYCKDAFDGVRAMAQIESGEIDTSVLDAPESSVVLKEEITINPDDIVMPKRNNTIATPPFWGKRELKLADNITSLAFEWINHRVLFKQRWGYTSKGVDKAIYQKRLDETVWPTYERLKEQFLAEGLFEPVMLYGYYPCRGNDTELLLFDPSEGWHTQDERNREHFCEVQGRAIGAWNFPRQRKKPHRCISDFFLKDEHDIIALSCVSAGCKLSAYEKELYDAGRFNEYYQVHGLGVELAEALAEIVHKQVRLDLNISEGEGASLHDVRMNRYQGCRYSFGYPACPDLENNRLLFNLLKPEEHGITLSETFQMVPEQSTSALIVPHPNATYFNT